MPREGARLVVPLILLMGIVVITAPAVLMVMAFSSGRSELASQRCSGGSADTVEAVAGGSGFTSAQRTNAATVIAVGSRMRVPTRGIVVALAVAHQESRFQNYANDGRGGDLASDQIGIGRSTSLPHDAVGTDHGSLGIFQQQWPWWGDMRDLMTPAVAARKFYERLLKVPDWQELPVTVAGQTVQRSAYPDAYADDEAVALQLLGDDSVTAAAEESGASLDPADCVSASEYSGGVVPPVEGAVDQHNFGNSGANWARSHTGTDFSASCGTPVVAAHAGQVKIRTDQGWAGPWLLQVSTGEGRLTTWYAHMGQVRVRVGENVRAGELIGQVGTLGNSTGCHLHFEVHPHGGSIYEDPVDPSAWLERHQQEDLDVAVTSTPRESGGDYLVGTLNVLGHSHTRPGGNKPGWRPATRRMRGVVSLIDHYGISVLGFQEFEGIQKRTFRRLAGDRYGVFSPGGDPVNSIAWRKDRFALVSKGSLPVPYFNGLIKRKPVVRLRDRDTGQDSIYINVHNPADTRRFPRQARHRGEAVRRERRAVLDLHQRYDLPVLLVGDLNSNRRAFCELTRAGSITAAAGGSTGRPCAAPQFRGIDWILGAGVNWAGHWSLSKGIRGSVTDHPLVVARVRTGGDGRE